MCSAMKSGQVGRATGTTPESGAMTHKVGQRITVSASEVGDIVAGTGRLVDGLRGARSERARMAARSGLRARVQGLAHGRKRVIAIEEQDRQNVVADGLKTFHVDKGNRGGNKSVSLGSFLNEINSLGRRFGSHQPPHLTPGKAPPSAPPRKVRGRCRWGSVWSE